MSVVNFLLFHIPFFSFVFDNFDCKKFNGIVLIISLILVMVIANTFVFYLLCFISRFVGKILMVLTFVINSIAVYFINTYSIIIDESMIGNIINTNYQESSSFFSVKLIMYIIVLGIIPSVYTIKVRILNVPLRNFLITSSCTLSFLVCMAFANAANWLWIDKHSKTLGGLAMPWSYSVNSALFYIHKYKRNEKEILLPDAVMKDNEKTVVVLVIGESARSENFSLYGYSRNTNPLLSKVQNLYSFEATSCGTYTTAGVKCILEHRYTDELYEILPNYLFRHNVDVIWRTTNWGEPPVHIKKYQDKENLESHCKGKDCDYDEILLTDLKEQILKSTKNKVFIVLHTSTSHGPLYSKKYPLRFENFTPVCTSVELGNCSQQELINAYDNTIIYTDYLLYNVIQYLEQLKDYKSTMLFVSDHGESLGEKNLYMHGIPISIAPKQQYEIPFIVWVSEDSKKLKSNNISLSQHHVFHSVMYFLGIQSPIYNEELNIFR